MPKISEEEWKEYITLKRKDEIRQKEIDKFIREGVPSAKKWRSDLNTIRGWASVFAKVLEQEWVRRDKPETFVLDRWRIVQKYLPERTLALINGKMNISKQFRAMLKKYGFYIRIDYKLGLFEVTKNL